MQVIQPDDWAKPRGFSHGLRFEGQGQWIVLAGQTGDTEGVYPQGLGEQADVALKKVVRLLKEAGGDPSHIVRLNWFLIDRTEYSASGADIGAAWKGTLGKVFPPSTLLFVSGLADPNAKVEFEVTAFVPAS